MLGAPLIVCARLAFAASVLLRLAPSTWIVLADALSLTSVLAEALGFLDLSNRVRGSARIAARAVASLPVAAFVALIIACMVEPHFPSTRLTVWWYAVDAWAAVLALYLASRRHLVFVAAAVAATALNAFGLTTRILDVIGAGVVGTAVVGRMATMLVAAVALLAGRDVPPSRVAVARIARTLARSVVGFVALGLFSVVQLATNGALSFAWLACLGYLALAIAGFRARTRSTAGFVPCVAALIAFGCYAAVASYLVDGSAGATPLLAHVSGLVAISAFAIVYLRGRYGVAIAVLGCVAIAAHLAGATALSFGTEVVVQLVAARAIVAAARDVAAEPEPTVAEVFA